MFDLVKSCHGKPCDFTALNPTCITAPPIPQVLLEPHYFGTKMAGNVFKWCLINCSRI